MDVVRAIRNLRAEKNVKPKQHIPATLVGGDHTVVLQRQSATIAHLARLDTEKFTIQESLESKPDGNIALVIGSIEAYLPLEGLVDTAEQRTRLEKELSETSSQIERLEALLSSPFAEKAPANVVEKERSKLSTYLERAEKIKSQLETLNES
ncbi:MAG: valine--tRNA ligase, partial [Anaerolineales bacterium]